MPLVFLQLCGLRLSLLFTGRSFLRGVAVLLRLLVIGLLHLRQLGPCHEKLLLQRCYPLLCMLCSDGCSLFGAALCQHLLAKDRNLLVELGDGLLRGLQLLLETRILLPQLGHLLLCLLPVESRFISRVVHFKHQVLNFIMTAQEPGVVCQMLEIGVDAQIGILVDLPHVGQTLREVVHLVKVQCVSSLVLVIQFVETDEDFGETLRRQHIEAHGDPEFELLLRTHLGRDEVALLHQWQDFPTCLQQ
mmetsp:Transcript_4498/g.10499  ORF Transcript_4498/g.10499 Transcript_4498/m.10499 type:complete len:247 (-) Transcript_4498:1360-2100(-)